MFGLSMLLVDDMKGKGMNGGSSAPKALMMGDNGLGSLFFWFVCACLGIHCLVIFSVMNYLMVWASSYLSTYHGSEG